MCLENTNGFTTFVKTCFTILYGWKGNVFKILLLEPQTQNLWGKTVTSTEIVLNMCYMRLNVIELFCPTNLFNLLQQGMFA